MFVWRGWTKLNVNWDKIKYSSSKWRGYTGGLELYFQSFLISVLGRCEWLNSPPSRSSSTMYSRYPFNMKLVGLKRWSEPFSEKSLFPCCNLTSDQESERKYHKHKSRLLQPHKRASLTTTYCLITAVIKSPLTLRVLMSYIYGAPILDVSRSHTTTQHSR